MAPITTPTPPVPDHPADPSASRWSRLDLSTRTLIVLLMAGGVAMAALAAFGFPTFLPYGWHLTLHIFGAVMFLGNILVTALWMVLLSRTGDARLMHKAGQATQWADVAFTAPGVLLLVANGMIMLEAIGGLAAHPWAALSLGLFGVTGIVWLALLVPTQERLVSLAAKAAAAGTKLGEEYARAFKRWAIAGSLATLLPLVVLALMVLKPGLG